jgi:hypothetical protein
MVPSSRFASSLKPSVAYLDLNLCALWKKQTTLPSLAYAGIPYQVFGQRSGALALTIDLREHVAFPGLLSGSLAGSPPQPTRSFCSRLALRRRYGSSARPIREPLRGIAWRCPRPLRRVAPALGGRPRPTPVDAVRPSAVVTRSFEALGSASDARSSTRRRFRRSSRTRTATTAPSSSTTST